MFLSFLPVEQSYACCQCPPGIVGCRCCCCRCAGRRWQRGRLGLSGHLPAMPDLCARRCIEPKETFEPFFLLKKVFGFCLTLEVTTIFERCLLRGVLLAPFSRILVSEASERSGI